MVGDLPPAPGEQPTASQPPGPTPWAPAFPMQPPPRPRTWPAIALAAIAVVLGIAALVVALARPTNNQSTASSITPTTPSYSADQVATAHKKLCDAYNLAAHAVQIETHGPSPERAGIAEVNGAMMLERVVNATPAIMASERAAALALADAYNNIAAVASLNDNSAWQPALDDANAKDAAMKRVCGD